MATIPSPVRLALEVFGVVVYLAVHVPIMFLYALGSSLDGVGWLPYWSVLALGYAAMLVVALSRPGPIAAVEHRAMLDAWLLSAPLAAVGAMVMVAVRWPLVFDTWEGHGMGVNGGEANSVLFPWIHALIWVGALAYVGSRYPAVGLDGRQR
jgi:hypothetical protein